MSPAQVGDASPRAPPGGAPVQFPAGQPQSPEQRAALGGVPFQPVDWGEGESSLGGPPVHGLQVLRSRQHWGSLESLVSCTEGELLSHLKRQPEQGESMEGCEGIGDGKTVSRVRS